MVDEIEHTSSKYIDLLMPVSKMIIYNKDVTISRLWTMNISTFTMSFCVIMRKDLKKLSGRKIPN